MGILSSIRGAFEEVDGSDESAKATQEAVEILAKLGEAKGELFEKTIRDNLRTAGTAENPTVPIQMTVDSFSETYAFVSQDASAIADTVKDAIEQLSPGVNQNVSEGVSMLIGHVLGGFLGDAKGSNTTKRKYIVYTEGLSIVRLDYLAWKLNVESSGLFEKRAKRVSTIVLVKSTVDVARLDLNSFLHLYQHQLKHLESEKAIREALEEARRVYDFFQSSVAKTPIHYADH